MVIAVAVALGGCALGVLAVFVLVDGPSSPAPLRKNATAWDTIGRGVAEDGSVSASVALDAFSLLFGPISSSRRAPAPDRSVPFCGTLAVRWVRASWASIGAADRAKIESMLSSSARARAATPWGVSLAHALPPGDEAALRVRVAALARRIETLVGVPLRKRIVVEVLSTDGLHDDEPSWWRGATDPPPRAWVEAAFVPGAARPRDTPECRIRVGQHVFRVDERTSTSALAHEVFHCFQLDAFEGTTAQWLDLRARASWMIEGAAAWVGESVAGASTAAANEQWWWAYFTASPRGRWSLGPTSFEAIGFYAFLDEQGARSWRHVLPIVNLEPDAAFARLTAAPVELLSSWPSSTRLRTSWGPAWDQRGSVVRRDGGPRDPVPRLALALGAAPVVVETDARTTTVVDITLAPGGDVVVIEAAGFGRARLAADAAHDVAWPDADTNAPASRAHSVRRFVCRTARACTCPDGRTLAPWADISRDTPLVVALAGGATESSRASVRVASIDDACRMLPPVGPSRDPCLLGEWSLDLEHARAGLAQTTPSGQTLRAVTGSYTTRFESSGESASRLTRYGVTMSAGGVESTSEIDGTSSARWQTDIARHAGRAGSRGVLRLSGGRNDLRASAVVRVAGRTMRSPVPIAAGQGGVASAAEIVARYECSSETLTLDHDPPAIDQRFTRAHRSEGQPLRPGDGL